MSFIKRSLQVNKFDWALGRLYSWKSSIIPCFIPKRRFHLTLDCEEKVFAFVDVVFPLLDFCCYVSLPYLIISVVFIFRVNSIRMPVKYTGCIYSTIVISTGCSWHGIVFIFPFHAADTFSP